MRISLKTETLKRSHNEIRKLKRKITTMKDTSAVQKQI